MGGSKSIQRTIRIVLATAAAAALVLCLPLLPSVLTVRSTPRSTERSGDGHLLWANATPGAGFTISFTHSANKGHITESYRFLGNGRFTLASGTFENYGAGMLDQLPEGVLQTEEGDHLRLDFPEKPMTELPMIPGKIANHILTGEGYTLNLADLSAYSGIILRYERLSIAELLSARQAS